MKRYALLSRLSPHDRRDTPILQPLRLQLQHQVLSTHAHQSARGSGLRAMRLKRIEQPAAQDSAFASACGFSFESWSGNLVLPFAAGLAVVLCSPAYPRSKWSLATDADCSGSRTTDSRLDTSTQCQQKASQIAKQTAEWSKGFANKEKHR